MDEPAAVEGHTLRQCIDKESTMRSFKHTLLVVITSVGLAVGMLGMAYAAPAGSMGGEIIINNNTAKEVTDTGGLGIDIGGNVQEELPMSRRIRGDPNTAETVVQGVKHNGTLPAKKILIHDNKAENITNMGGRLIVQGVSGP